MLSLSICTFDSFGTVDCQSVVFVVLQVLVLVMQRGLRRIFNIIACNWPMIASKRFELVVHASTPPQTVAMTESTMPLFDSSTVLSR